MALARGLASCYPAVGRSLARSSPVFLGHVCNSMQTPSPCMPMVQKRTYIIGVVLHWAFDLTVITAGCAGIRRASGIDMRQYVDHIQNPSCRNFLYRYLDFGETCVDKLMSFYHQTVRPQVNDDFREYVKHKEACRRYEERHPEVLHQDNHYRY